MTEKCLLVTFNQKVTSALVSPLHTTNTFASVTTFGVYSMFQLSKQITLPPTAVMPHIDYILFNSKIQKP